MEEVVEEAKAETQEKDETDHIVRAGHPSIKNQKLQEELLQLVLFGKST